MRPILITYTFLILAGLSCTLTDDRIKKHWWKYGEGFHMGDVLILDNKNLLNDTIFINGKPKAIIVDKVYGLIGDDNEIIIKSLLTNEKGIYHEK